MNNLTNAMKSRMFYFGCWDSPGHYFFTESGQRVWEYQLLDFPFGHHTNKIPVDGCIHPGCYLDDRGKWRRDHAKEIQGHALLHHVKGPTTVWTALSFWDRSVDPRPASNSTYFAEGEYTFKQMVEMAKTRFASRWSKMTFPVVLVK